MGISNVKILEQRLRDLEFARRRIQNTPGTKSTEERKLRTDGTTRRSQAYRAAPAREVRWLDEDESYNFYPEDYQYDDQEYFEYHDSRPCVYAAEERQRPPTPRGADTRRREDGYTGYRPRQFQDWSSMECKDCGRPGHPTDRCLYRCKGCHKVHQEGACPLTVQLITLAQQLRRTQGETPLPPEVQDILKLMPASTKA